MKDRAIRRHHRKRMKAKAVRVFKTWDRIATALLGFTPERSAGYYADNLAKCSCSMCRNLRRDHGDTRQEIIAQIRDSDSL